MRERPGRGRRRILGSSHECRRNRLRLCVRPLHGDLEAASGARAERRCRHRRQAPRCRRARLRPQGLCQQRGAARGSRDRHCRQFHKHREPLRGDAAGAHARKHVYSEKPLVTSMTEAAALMDLAAEKGVRLSCAPSNAMSDTVQTMWKAVRDGAVGDVRIVYAEFDDNVIYRMHPETWRSRTGAPWPYLHEFEQGCTYEHVGYHLTWLCAIFGPVRSVTAFSKRVLPDKTDKPLNPPDTPDFSVACLDFESGVVARVTCSVGVPFDHRMRIVGNQGMLTVDTYRHYQCPVYLERFSQLSLNARKAMSVRTNTLLQSLFGVGGKTIRLLRIPPPGAGRDTLPGTRWWSPGDVLRAARRRELGQQDKTVGIAELADAIQTDRPSFPPPDFTLHLTELTLAIQGAGVSSAAVPLKTTFSPISPRL